MDRGIEVALSLSPPAFDHISCFPDRAFLWVLCQDCSPSFPLPSLPCILLLPLTDSSLRLSLFLMGDILTTTTLTHPLGCDPFSLASILYPSP